MQLSHIWGFHVLQVFVRLQKARSDLARFGANRQHARMTCSRGMSLIDSSASHALQARQKELSVHAISATSCLLAASAWA